MSPAAQSPSPRPWEDIPFSSSGIRLSWREWGIALGLVVAILACLPAVWQRIEPLEPDADYRVPYSLGSDYWLYRRYSRTVQPRDRIVVAGDSVVWGHYVSSRETLSHCLNAAGFGTPFANLGVDGAHPAALAGLLRYYGASIDGTRVVLQCNPLWLSSQKHDLQTKKEFSFNHPDLVPQLVPRIPCFQRPVSRRIGTLVGRYVPVFGWVEHLRMTSFGGKDIASWTLEHPHRNPFRAVTLKLPSPDEEPDPRPDTRPWTAKGLAFSPSWVEMKTSFQWASFLRCIEILKARGNRVFVVVGPMNEPMMQGEALAKYLLLKAEMHRCLAEQGIPHYLVSSLPSELYADASHPVGAGYELVARQLAADGSFRAFCGEQAGGSGGATP
jgi:hypothetical protein